MQMHWSACLACGMEMDASVAEALGATVHDTSMILSAATTAEPCVMPFDGQARATAFIQGCTGPLHWLRFALAEAKATCLHRTDQPDLQTMHN